MAKLLKDEHILGLTNVHFEKDRICKACQAKKQVGIPHPPKNIVTTTSPLELIHMDLFGPVVYVSIGGNKYGLVIIDDYSYRRIDQFIRVQVQWQPASGRTIILEPI